MVLLIYFWYGKSSKLTTLVVAEHSIIILTSFALPRHLTWMTMWQREGRIAREYSLHSMLFRVSIKRLHFIIGGNFFLLWGSNIAFFQSMSFHVDWHIKHIIWWDLNAWKLLVNYLLWAWDEWQIYLNILLHANF